MLRFIFILLFISSLAHAQGPAKFYTRYFTTENGLPSNGVKGIQWDEKTGFLWIATEAGVSRFNGIDFRNFNHDNTPAITAERMLFLVRNSKGHIYTSDQVGNILRVNNNNLALFEKYKSAPKGYFGNLFTVIVSDTFYHHNKDKYQTSYQVGILTNPIIPIGDTACYFVAGNKLYWYSFASSEPRLYADNSFVAMGGFKLKDKVFVVDRKLKIHQMNEDPSLNRIYSIVNEDGSEFKFFNVQSRYYWTNKMDNPVVIHENNAWVLNWDGDKIVASLICDEIPTGMRHEYVQYSPSKKLLFLGTHSKGIIVISRNRVEVIKMETSNPNDHSAYYSQLALPNNTVITGEGHILGKEKPNPAISPIKGKYTNYINKSSDSLLWYTQSTVAFKYTHLCSFNYTTRETKEYPNIQTAENIVKEISGNRLFISTEAGMGFLIYDSINYIYRHPDGSFNNTINNFIETKPGLILIASGSGILQFNIATKKLDTISVSKGSVIRSLWKYKDYIFFGSYGKGFYIWKNGIVKSMPLDKKKYLLYSHCFMEDDYGYCWISTNRGLFKANIQELINAYESGNPIVYYHYFGKSDGMEMIEMNGGCLPCAVQLANKTISFPTMDGLLWVDPSIAHPILPDGEIFIDEIIADSSRFNPQAGEKIVLPAKTKDIQIKLAFSGWCNQENIYVYYQINDTVNWKPLNGDGIIHLVNLPAGNYDLKIRKINGFGVSNYSYKTIKFYITVPWHQRWWFSLLAALALSGVVALYLHFRTRQLKSSQRKLENQVAEKTKELQQQNEILEKNNTIKTRLISIISHDIVTPLKFLTVAGKNLLEKKQLMSEELQQETIGEITNTSQELQLLSTNILNWIKYQNENRRLAKESFILHEMVQQVLGILNSLAQQKNLRIVNEVDKYAEVYQYYEPLKILVYNLLTNAIHFSERGTISVSMRKENLQVILSVKDEGVGMSPEKVQSLMGDHIVISSANVDNKKGHGLGFLIIKDLLKTMGATLEIDSKLGKGSKISIIFPA